MLPHQFFLRHVYDAGVLYVFKEVEGDHKNGSVKKASEKESNEKESNEKESNEKESNEKEVLW